MRSWIVWGSLLIVLLLGRSLFGQVSGVVETVGLDGRYRPGCWVPMLLKLQLDGAVSGTYEIHVAQYDADGDIPLCTQRVTLTGSTASDGPKQQSVWVYFLPQPVRNGLPKPPVQPGRLQDVIHVSVHDLSGREIAVLPITSSFQGDIDPPVETIRTEAASRFVVFVSTGSKAAVSELGRDHLLGTSEKIEPVVLPPESIPDNVLGYDGVDAVVWLSGDPAQLSESASPKLDALREYVRSGGHLVICNSPDQAKLHSFDDLLPVEFKPEETRANKDISQWAQLMNTFHAWRDSSGQRVSENPWKNTKGELAVQTCRVSPKLGSYREGLDATSNVIHWDDGSYSPWLVRRGYGYGCTTFVAQDLTDSSLPSQGWAFIWYYVIGVNAKTLVLEPSTQDKLKWTTQGLMDAGYSLLAGMDLPGRSATLQAVAGLFFVGYWVVAGPVLFFVLRARGVAQYSWFIFGATAVLATLLTLGIVRLLLSGPPEVVHVSVVRNGIPGTAALVTSRIGMYVPRDGTQRITLDNAGEVTQFTPVISQFPRQDVWTKDELLVKAPKSYAVNAVRAPGQTDPIPEVDPYFRTTQKQIMARWSGNLDPRIDGRVVAAARQEYLDGKLTNSTGKTMQNVYFAWRQGKGDYIMYVNKWENNQTLDLAALYQQGDETTPKDAQQKPILHIGSDVSPDNGKLARGEVTEWVDYWYPSMGRSRLSNSDARLDDYNDVAPRSVPILSLFGRLPARPAGDVPRIEILRRGARDLDVSNAMLAGNLVIVATVDGQPLPLPLKVAGSDARGTGRIIYQLVLPVDRNDVYSQPASTQPTP